MDRQSASPGFARPSAVATVRCDDRGGGSGPGRSVVTFLVLACAATMACQRAGLVTPTATSRKTRAGQRALPPSRCRMRRLRPTPPPARRWPARCREGGTAARSVTAAAARSFAATARWAKPAGAVEPPGSVASPPTLPACPRRASNPAGVFAAPWATAAGARLCAATARGARHEEKILEFILFDMSACLQSDTVQPQPPPVHQPPPSAPPPAPPLAPPAPPPLAPPPRPPVIL
jgi:hypothetical protein